MRHFLYVPFTGLGLYNGFRGNRWLRNRIKVFKQFVVPSLKNQTNQNFKIWVSWREQERTNKYVKDLFSFLEQEFPNRVVFTYSGVCFWDDKYPDNEARERLMTSIHGSMNEIINHIGDVDHVIMTIQPSDDLYNNEMVEEVQRELQKYEAVGYKKGYIMSYATKELLEYTPLTNPPFYSIKFSKEDFIDPFKHADYTSLKKDVGQYKKGTPLPSHEYVGECLKYKQIDKRGFLVGTHGENISTHFNHPYGGNEVKGLDREHVMERFGIRFVKPLKLKISIRKLIMRKLPYGWQRKLRYWLGEKLFNSFYKFLRN